MIGIADKTRQAEAFYQVARDMIRLIHLRDMMCFQIS